MSNEPTTTNRTWMIGAVILVAVTGLALRYATNILDKGTVYDERFIRAPIDDLIARGWSVETAIDFTETKGPTMIWSYAIDNNLWPWRYLWANDVRPPTRVRQTLTRRVKRLDLVLSRADRETL